MSLLYQAPRGTQDLFADRADAWIAFRKMAYELFSRYGYLPVATPIFERSELFSRSAGTSTDIVSKEMFSVCSKDAMAKLTSNSPLKAEQRLSLRPEATAGVVRCAAEHRLITPESPAAKLFYAGPMFRCERPQRGRLRQFYQVGVECLGADDVAADAEMIIMCRRFFTELGVPPQKIRLLINSMGDETCRPAYTQAVRAYEIEHKDELCDDCRRRIDQNPLRSFDCKKPQCQRLMAKAPHFSDYLCEPCAARFAQVKAYLDTAAIAYEEDFSLVRGFDYYTGLVFELQIDEGLGAQSAVGGGGHYDKLFGEIAGTDICGLGFALGFERIMLVLDALGIELALPQQSAVFVACPDEACRQRAFEIVTRLRDSQISVQFDLQHRSLKSQLKLANKQNLRLVIIAGSDELSRNAVLLRDMFTHEQVELKLEDLNETLKKRLSCC